MTKRKFPKIIYFLVCFLLIFEQSLPAGRQAAFAQVAGELDISGLFLQFGNSLLQDKFRPLHLRYLSYDNLHNNFKLLLDQGDIKANSSLPAGRQKLENTSRELLKYFFIGISLPNDSFWVNLRPDSPDNIIDPYLAQTDVGKILLEADLQLKKDTANFTSPQTQGGKDYWRKLYQKANELFGGENITIPTLTRPWIVPGEIIIRETQENAYIYKATLKVMLEQDYLKDSAAYNFKDERLKVLNEYSSQLIRELIIPKLAQEVNNAKRYAPLRQVYYSLIIAQWFKQKFSDKSGIYSQLINKMNLNGLTSKESWSKDTYFQAYKKSFKEGEYNIKEPVYTLAGQTIRSYMSGGLNFSLINQEIVSSAITSHRGMPQIKGTSSAITTSGTADAPFGLRIIFPENGVDISEPASSPLSKRFLPALLVINLFLVNPGSAPSGPVDYNVPVVQLESRKQPSTSLGSQADILIKKGIELFNSGNTVEAIDAFNRAIELNPNSFEAHNNLGVAYEGKGLLEGAKVEFEKAIKLNPQSANAHGNLGKVLFGLSRKEENESAKKNLLNEGAKELKIAVEIGPKNADVLYDLGSILEELESFGEAAAAYNNAIEIAIESKSKGGKSTFDLAEAYYRLGAVYDKSNRFPEAIAAYEKAIGINPDYAKAYYNLGLVYIMNRGPEFQSIGLALLEKAVKLNPNIKQLIPENIREIMKLKTPLNNMPVDSAVEIARGPGIEVRRSSSSSIAASRPSDDLGKSEGVPSVAEGSVEKKSASSSPVALSVFGGEFKKFTNINAQNLVERLQLRRRDEPLRHVLTLLLQYKEKRKNSVNAAIEAIHYPQNQYPYNCEPLTNIAMTILKQRGYEAKKKTIEFPKEKYPELPINKHSYIILPLETKEGIKKEFIVDPAADQFEPLDRDNREFADLGVVVLPVDIVNQNPERFWMYTGQRKVVVYKSKTKEPSGVIPSTGSPVTTDSKGGIDLRNLPSQTTIQQIPLGSVSSRAGLAKLQGAPRRIGAAGILPSAAGQSLHNLDAEWQQIEKMAQAGLIPSNERIREYLQASCESQDCSQRIDKALSLFADILRLEEERVMSTDLPLKEMLALLESDKPANEMQIVLANIIVLEKEPLTIAQ